MSSGTCDLILSNLDGRSADLNLLNVLFDNHVKDALWFGSGPDRCVIVSLDSEAYGEKVLLAQKTFRDPALRVPVSVSKPKRKRCTTESAPPVSEGADDMTVEELLTLETRNRPSQQSAVESAIVVPTETMIHFNEIVCNGRAVFVDKSPIPLAAILATNAIPAWARSGEDRRIGDPEIQSLPKKKLHDVSSKRNRDEPNSSGGFRQPSKFQPQTAAGLRSTRVALDGDDSAEAIPLDDTKELCSSGTKIEIRSAPSKPQQKTEPTPPPTRVVIPVAERSSKDACKFCGSELHLSRHCPDKNKK
mmetsp:Transcript_82416/g.96398  ORF Transcript_82416/g.96398 Transcript_82416/m.96398 type:complete len:304 (+) Transcript_82416:15-926(+)